MDDEESVVRMIRDLLSVLKCELFTTTTGKDAVRIASHLPYLDLLITDLVMPEMDGFELAQRVVPIHPGAKVVLMSGYNPRKAQDIVDNKRFFFVAKPIAPTAFLDQVRRLLGLVPQARRRL